VWRLGLVSFLSAVPPAETAYRADEVSEKNVAEGLNFGRAWLRGTRSFGGSNRDSTGQMPWLLFLLWHPVE
jgi:hypothetical protein